VIGRASFCVRGSRARASSAVDHAEKRGSARVVEAQRVGYEVDRLAPRNVRSAAFQVADTARAQPGTLGELLLRQISQTSVVPQQLAKAGVGFTRGHASPLWHFGVLSRDFSR
jgi:hypothetical protein